MLTFKSCLLSIFIILICVVIPVFANEEIFQFMTIEGDIIQEAVLVKTVKGVDKIQFIELLKKLEYDIGLTKNKKEVKFKSYFSDQKEEILDLLQIPSLELINDGEDQQIWISIHDFEKIFPFKLEKNINKLNYIVESTSKNTAIRKLTQSKSKIRDISDDHIKWSHDPKSLNLDYSMSAEASQNRSLIGSTMSLTGPILYHDMNSQIFQTGQDYELNLNFSRRKKSKADLLGPLRAVRYEFGSVVLPGLEHVSGQIYGTGFTLSNTTDEQALLFYEKSIFGMTRPLWQVYVYLNDVLISNTQSDEFGKYILTDIPFYKGLNQLKLVFRGPVQQEYIEEKYYEYDYSFSKEKFIQYEYGLGSNQKNQFIQIVKLDKYLNPYISLNFSYMNEINNSENNYLQPRLRFRNGSYNADIFMTSALDSDAKAFGVSQKVIFEDSLIKYEHSAFDRLFKSELVNNNSSINTQLSSEKIEYQTKVKWLFSHLYFSHDVNEFVGLQPEKSISSRWLVSLYSAYAFYNHEWNYELDWQQDNLLELGFIKDKNKIQFNAYHISFLNPYYDILFERQMNDRLTAGAFTSLHENPLLNFFGVQMNYKFDRFQLYLKTQYSQLGETEIKLGLNGSVFYNNHAKNTNLSSVRRGAKGQVLMHLFLDQNQNGIYDLEDIKLKRVQLLNQLTNEIKISDENGEIYFEAIDSYKAQNFKILTESIPNIYITPDLEYIDFILTAAEFKKIEIPFSTSSEMTGSILLKNKKIKAGQFEIELLHESGEKQTVKLIGSDFYSFKTKMNGNVKIYLRFKSDQNIDFKIQPSFYKVEIPKVGKFISDINFILK